MCAFLLSLVLPAQATSFTEYLPMSDSEYRGFYTASKTGVDDLLDLQGNGHTQLLDMQFDSGYWITSLYQVKDAKWQRVHGWFGKLSYPALTRFTYTPNRKLVLKPIAGRDPQTEDLAQTQRCLIKGDVLDGVNQN
ncbi:hypothetical protein [Shigella sonnei]|uniref:hypothetical protein n=1 Tax=Shigella sonnei TaxID=624 RepID=UPI001C0A730B|nr:hypothetical protein [Shigella sonnei]